MGFAIFFVLLFLTVLLILAIRTVNSSLKTILNPIQDPQVIIPPDIKQWLDERDFAFVGCFTISNFSHSFVLHCWQNNQNKALFVSGLFEGIYVPNASAYYKALDIGIEFADQIALGTSTFNGHIMPRKPGEYKQTFSNITLNDLWQKHKEAESFLLAHEARYSLASGSIKEIYEKSVRDQAIFIKSLWLWPFRVIYRALIGKYFWHNKTIEEQYEKRMIKLPDELS